MVDVGIQGPIIADQLNTKSFEFRTPTYKYSKILPQSGQQIATLTTAGGSYSVFEFPNKVYNLSRSILSGQLVIPDSGNGNFEWTEADCLNFVRSVLFTSRGGIELGGNLQELGNYTKTVWKPETKLDEFKNFDIYADSTAVGVGGAGRMLRRSNQLAVAPATVSANKTPINGATSISYDEPLYVISKAGTVGALSTLILNFKIPLRMIYNTIFSVDEDLFFNEVMIATFNWAPSTKIYWTGNSGTDPTAAAAIAAGNVLLSDLTVFVAVEVNPEIEASIRNDVMTKGLSLLVPVVHYNKANLTGTSQSVSYRFNRSHGSKLVKIYHSLFNNIESSNTMYDNQNLSVAAAPIAGLKVNNYYTMLDNMRLQEFNIDCTKFEDWMMVQDKCKGSALLSQGVFGNSWFHLESLGDLISPLDKPVHPNENNLIRGLDLNSERKWDIYLTTAAGPFNHYTYAVCLRTLTINSAGISFV